MNEWLKIIQERDDRIKELETNYQKWSNEDRVKMIDLEKRLQAAESMRDHYHKMIRQLAEDQNPVKVLTEGMALVLERDHKIKELQDRLQTAERRGDDNYTRLQNVLEVRDVLLKHVYTLLDRPNGIMLHDMPGEIEKLLEARKRFVTTLNEALTELREYVTKSNTEIDKMKQYTTQLEAEIRAAKQSDEDDFGSMTCHRRSS